MKINTEGKVPVKMWLEDIEEGALVQIRNLANLPFAFNSVAVMPDAHQGYGMPIGGVLATHGVVIPNAVGVDIGCGMCAVKTSLKELSVETLKEIMGEVRHAVPVGFNHHKERQDDSFMPDASFKKVVVCERQYQSATYQVGTLGGGNHFIEIQKGSDGHIWIMIHSGSRNLGKQVADFYNDIAVKMNEKWHSIVPKEWELAFLPLDSDEGKAYINEMNYCVEFAFKNRQLMMKNIEGVFSKKTQCSFEPLINIAHNYARMEHHMGRDVMVHRKGATSARIGEVGIIPGSQGTKSYIVKGKGNIESFQSCSHGAGRRMGRKQAERTLNLEEEIKKLNDQGIVHGIRTAKDLDEASGAYKDISVVMENQKDLVEIVVELSPMGVIKG
jgi:tRNA-splicing ligase RtcB